MPVIQNSDFTPSLILKNGHLNTIFSNLFRPKKDINFKRERVFTPDDDFLDLDFSTINSNVLVLIGHGLEGSSNSLYVNSMVTTVNKTGWDAAAINWRSCSGEPNRLYSSYHSGKTEDLDFILQHIFSNYNYKTIFLVGFSLGGNIMLKYAGEKSLDVPFQIKAFAGVSVPCDLKSASENLNKVSNRLYLLRFLKTLKEKIKVKKQNFPESNLNFESIDQVKNFNDFDNLYTAPAHGFENALDYWQKCSCINFLVHIKTPSYLINAQDDPFIPSSCYPYQEALNNPNLYFEAPEYGGHVGFSSSIFQANELYHEIKIIEFFKKQLH
jgi:predicted alpha/beta-fold hydrolase